ncbi:hypothetical protein ABZ070_34895 [Streptomyces sp. NPDC006283]|uniref:hypothetical protein n=1 Tax=Streptomyces sp. NPDC006283 TaxID=3156741 RepID=UPI0033A15302
MKMAHFLTAMLVVAALALGWPSAGQAVTPAAKTHVVTASTPIVTNGVNYPAVVSPARANGDWLMFLGGIASDVPAAQRKGLALTYPISQEQIWMARSTSSPSLTAWSTPRFTFGIDPSTRVAGHDNRTYAEVWPRAFSQGCDALPRRQCNVQVNDPSVVRYNGALYLYFTMLENWRWYDGSLGQIVNGQPTNPAEQNAQAIGLAVSTNEGAHWAFVDKVVPENGVTDTAGQPLAGAWAPSAMVAGADGVDVWFHDAKGAQYAAQLAHGATLRHVTRLNVGDATTRLNLDVRRTPSGQYDVWWNDAQFNIRRALVNAPTKLGSASGTIVVPSDDGRNRWPTPHTVLGPDGHVHLFFWLFGNTRFVHHWVVN